MRGDILAHLRSAYLTNRASQMHGGPWVFHPRRGGCRTPECGTVISHRKAGSGSSVVSDVYPFGHAPADSSGTASSPHGETVSSPCVPRGKERGEYMSAGGGGDNFAPEAGLMVTEILPVERGCRIADARWGAALGNCPLSTSKYCMPWRERADAEGGRVRGTMSPHISALRRVMPPHPVDASRRPPSPGERACSADEGDCASH